MTDPIQQEIDAKATAPRVTPADIEAAIASEHYFTAQDGRNGALYAGTYAGREKPTKNDADLAPLGLLTFCVLVLSNGHTVTGESHCQDLAKFDAQIGRIEARKSAIEKFWPMAVYAARQDQASIQE